MFAFAFRRGKRIQYASVDRTRSKYWENVLTVTETFASHAVHSTFPRCNHFCISHTRKLMARRRMPKSRNIHLKFYPPLIYPLLIRFFYFRLEELLFLFPNSHHFTFAHFCANISHSFPISIFLKIDTFASFSASVGSGTLCKCEEYRLSESQTKKNRGCPLH